MRLTWPVFRLAPASAALAAVALAAGCASTPGGTNPPGPAGSSSAASAPAPASTTPALTSTGKPNSCNVITAAEASAALGQPVKPPRRGKAIVEGGVACVFYGPKAPPDLSPDVATYDVVRVVLVTGPNARKWFDDYRSKVNAQPIPGLGDSAFYDGYASISVLKGDAYVRIAVGTAPNLSQEKTLARDALPRM
ncbi:MAG TPA: hypothetical protein VF162_11270 [Streptosporangiaceae bacterium]